MSSKNIGHLNSLIFGRHSASRPGFLNSVHSRFNFHEILAMEPMELMNVIGSLSFEWLFLHSNNQQIVDKSFQTILSDIVFTQTPTLVDLMRVTHLVIHSIAASRQQDEINRAQLTIIASVLQQSKTILPVNSLDSLKELIFVRSGVLRDIMMTSSSSEVLQGIIVYYFPIPFLLHFRRKNPVRSNS